MGTSRKSFLGKITGAAPDERGLASAVSNALAVEHGAHILRVHDVSETRQAAAVAVSIAGGALPEECS